MITLIIQVIVITTLVVAGVWGISQPGQIASFIKVTPILSSKVISGDCPCPATFWTPIVFMFALLVKYQIFLNSRICAIEMWGTEGVMSYVISAFILIGGLIFATLGTAGMLYLVRRVIEHTDLKGLFNEIKKAQ